MAYFIILPAFVLWLLAATGAVIAVRLTPRLAAVFPYVLRVAVWGTLGFLAANAALIGLLALGLVALDNPSATSSLPHDVGQIAWGLAALGGPFIASALGWMSGCALGVLLAFLRTRRDGGDHLFQARQRRQGRTVLDAPAE
jgi:hypothetical protein